MLTRKLMSAAIVLFAMLAGGCGTGIIEKLGDIPDHCEFEWGTEGRLELGLQCL